MKDVAQQLDLILRGAVEVIQQTELEAKLRKGYPSDNILFEDTVQAVLLQNGQESRRVLLANDAGRAALLAQFFAFRPPEVRSCNGPETTETRSITRRRDRST